MSGRWLVMASIGVGGMGVGLTVGILGFDSPVRVLVERPGLEAPEHPVERTLPRLTESPHPQEPAPEPVSIAPEVTHEACRLEIDSLKKELSDCAAAQAAEDRIGRGHRRALFELERRLEEADLLHPEIPRAFLEFIVDPGLVSDEADRFIDALELAIASSRVLSTAPEDGTYSIAYEPAFEDAVITMTKTTYTAREHPSKRFIGYAEEIECSLVLPDLGFFEPIGCSFSIVRGPKGRFDVGRGWSLSGRITKLCPPPISLQPGFEPEIGPGPPSPTSLTARAWTDEERERYLARMQEWFTNLHQTMR